MVNHDSAQNILRFEETVAETNSVAVVRQEYTAIANSNALHFQQSYDDLDELFFALLTLPSGNRVALVSHKHSPNPGTEICVSYDLSDVPSVIIETIRVLNLSIEDLTWVHHGLEQELYRSQGLSVPPRIDEKANYPQQFSGVDFSGCDLKNIDLSKADLKNTIFIEADLNNANLEQADLRGANLKNANLQGANLKSADLRNTNLEQADLRGADLENAIIDKLNLNNASS